MSSLTIEHNERDESWSCRSMNMRASSLKALKAKIDKFDGQARKVSVPVLYMGNYQSKSIQATVVMIAKPKDWEQTTDYDKFERKVTRHPSAWLQIVKGNEVTRRKVRLDTCLVAGPDTDAAMEAIRRREEVIATMTAEIKDLYDGIPRMTLEQLATSGATEDDSE